VGDIGKLATSPECEVDGVWSEYQLGILLRIARKPNAKYTAFKLERIRAVHASLQDGTIDEAAAEGELARIETEATGRFVLLDWENLDLNGEPHPYTPERSVALLGDPALHDFREHVDRWSARAYNFRAAKLAESVGNSRGPSPGG
jgi:hypothetical protein